MSEAGGISRMGAVAGGDVEAPELGIGLLGTAFMCNAHTNAFLSIPHNMYPPVAFPRLVALSGRNEANLNAAADRYGYQHRYTRWQDMLENDAVQVFDNGGPNNVHAEPCIAAAEAGRHVFCEKPLARTAEEAKGMLDAAVKAGVKHMVAYNYRFVPAIIQARKLIQSGALGRIYHFRAAYLQDWIVDPEFPMTWRFSKEVAGSGSLGDLASHILDIGRFLVGEPNRVMGMKKTFIDERPDGQGGRATVDVDDAVTALLEFENGALGTIEATRFAIGNRNGNKWEVNGENGSIRFNLERLNELDVYWNDGRQETLGFTNVLISEGHHPYWEHWWPPGHIIGWEHTFIHEFHHFFDCIVNDRDVAPWGATFVDGYRNNVITDAIEESASTGRQVDIRYED
ncbi:MAG: Gfo/Idh/MocA family oxidoreductase [Anaerolineae bacterium]|nr:Gfo/Idh/MocA family oxidoreductase [Anaerolineae bacterium]